MPRTRGGAPIAIFPVACRRTVCGAAGHLMCEEGYSCWLDCCPEETHALHGTSAGDWLSDLQRALMLTSMPAPDQSSYNLSFTAASLRPELARIVAECYLQVGDWDLAKDRVLASNALQCRTTSRRGTSGSGRFAAVSCVLARTDLTWWPTPLRDDRAAMAWLAALSTSRSYSSLLQKCSEELATHDPVLRPSDYETYVDIKGRYPPELVLAVQRVEEARYAK